MIKRILKYMLNIVRMWRFARLVNKKEKLIGYKDDFLVGFYSNEKYKLPSEKDCIESFKVYSFNKTKRLYIAEQTCKSAVAESDGFLDRVKIGNLYLLGVNPGKGLDFIEILGLPREMVAKEWKLISVTLSIVGLVVGYIIGKYN